MGKILLAFDLGGTKLASGVVTSSGKVLDSKKEHVDFSRGKEGFLEFLLRTAKYWKARYPKISALGIASCGPLDIKTGTLLQPTNFPHWGNIVVAPYLQKKLRIPVCMDNDAAAAAGAEGWMGGAKNLKNWMMLTFGTGLGTGVVMDRKVFMGGSGLGPEAGHMIITEKKYPCGCGNFGCAEACLSGTGLQRRIEERRSLWEKKSIRPPVDPEELAVYARKKDIIALEIFEEFSEFLAVALHNYCILFKPEAVFFAGSVAKDSDLFLNTALKKLKPMLAGRKGFLPKMMGSKLGECSGILAGAWVVIHHKNLGKIKKINLANS